MPPWQNGLEEAIRGEKTGVDLAHLLFSSLLSRLLFICVFRSRPAKRDVTAGGVPVSLGAAYRGVAVHDTGIHWSRALLDLAYGVSRRLAMAIDLCISLGGRGVPPRYGVASIGCCVVLGNLFRWENTRIPQVHGVKQAACCIVGAALGQGA